MFTPWLVCVFSSYFNPFVASTTCRLNTSLCSLPSIVLWFSPPLALSFNRSSDPCTVTFCLIATGVLVWHLRLKMLLCRRQYLGCLNGQPTSRWRMNIDAFMISLQENVSLLELMARHKNSVSVLTGYMTKASTHRRDCKLFDFEEVMKFDLNDIHCSEGVHKSQASGRRRRLNVRWRLIFVGPQYGTCLISTFWRLELLGGS